MYMNSQFYKMYITKFGIFTEIKVSNKKKNLKDNCTSLVQRKKINENQTAMSQSRIVQHTCLKITLIHHLRTHHLRTHQFLSQPVFSLVLCSCPRLPDYFHNSLYFCTQNLLQCRRQFLVVLPSCLDFYQLTSVNELIS